MDPQLDMFFVRLAGSTRPAGNCSVTVDVLSRLAAERVWPTPGVPRFGHAGRSRAADPTIPPSSGFDASSEREFDEYRWPIDESFLINLADAPAIGAPRGATFIKLEPDGVSWPDTGVNVQVMQPGQPTGRYHSEPVQEDFLVLYGECIAIVDEEELRCANGTFSIAQLGAVTFSWELETGLALC